tara:strand:+ start:257 stop:511 length:255 start_codon:yes stop_codon:yes gene_type:complete
MFYFGTKYQMHKQRLEEENMNDPDLFNLVRSHSQLLEAIEYMAEQLEVNINKVMFNHISLNDRMLKKIEECESIQDVDDDGIPL